MYNEIAVLRIAAAVEAAATAKPVSNAKPPSPDNLYLNLVTSK